MPSTVLNIHGKGLGSILWRHWIKISRFSVHTIRIRSVFKNFPSGGRIQKAADYYAGFIAEIRVDGSRIRKEKVVDSKIPEYVWTGRYVHAFAAKKFA